MINLRNVAKLIVNLIRKGAGTRHTPQGKVEIHLGAELDIQKTGNRTSSWQVEKQDSSPCAQQKVHIDAKEVDTNESSQ